MDLKPPRISLPPEITQRCLRFGEAMVSAYKNPVSQSVVDSLSVSSHAMEADAVGQAYGKMAECALCIWLGKDCDCLKWDAGIADGGSDISWLSIKFDVKHTKYRSGKLIWPYRKVHLFEKKQFDVLVLVRLEGPFELAGWVWKDEFRSSHYIAQAGSKFTPGTLVYDGVLRSLYELSDMVSQHPNGCVCWQCINPAGLPWA